MTVPPVGAVVRHRPAGRETGKGGDTVSRKTAEQKREAAWHAVQYVESGMVVGLGHGSTAGLAMQCIAHLLQEGQLRDILAVPCSSKVEQEALRLGIPLTTLEEHPVVDVTIDGADEVDPHLDLIKGGGGAHLREKIVAQASNREIIAVDQSKLSPALGTRWAVPVEVAPFGWRSQLSFLESLGARALLRTTAEGTPIKTDQGNYILDCDFGPITEPAALAAELDRRAGVLEHGLFLGLATDVIVGRDDGVDHLERGEK
jgi:ribose 5-phosphate isomerase A